MSDPSSARKSWLVHYNELFGLWRQKKEHHSEAEDAIQDAAVNLLGRSDAHTIDNPRAYLSRSTTNGLINRHRHHAVLDTVSWDELGEADHPSSPSPESALHSQQLLEDLLRVLSELPLACQQVFIRHRIEGWSHHEIAAHMGVSRSMVEKHMIRALRHITGRLDHYAPSPHI